MGLATLDSKLSSAFDGALSPAVKSFTLTRVTNQGYNIATGQTSKTTSTAAGKGIFTNLNFNELRDYQTNYTSVKIICLASDLGIDPIVNDIVTYNSNAYIILHVKSDPMSVSRTLVCRLSENG